MKHLVRSSLLAVALAAAALLTSSSAGCSDLFGPSCKEVGASCSEDKDCCSGVCGCSGLDCVVLPVLGKTCLDKK